MSIAIDLDQIQVATPCDASWDDMIGDERVRRCQVCKLDVLNIAALTREEAVGLIQARAGERTCVRLFRRRDGTVITHDCPVGTPAGRRKARLDNLGVFAVAVLILATWFAFLTLTQRERGFGARNPVERAIDKVGHAFGINALCNRPVTGYILF